MKDRAREAIRAIAERTPWAPPRPIASSEVLFGIVVFVVIVATIVFGPDQSYRFYYGPQF